MINSFPTYKQLDQMDCGPACLQMIAKHYGRYFPLHELREKAFITREGVSLLGISDAAESIGLHTVGVKVTFEKLLDAPLPCIVHWYQRHFIVVYKFRKDKIFAADPAIGRIQYTRAEFEKGWLSVNDNGSQTGVAMLVEPMPAFYEQDRAEYDSKRKNILSLLSYLKGNGKLIFQLFLGLLTGSLIQLIFPFFTQSIVDVGVNTKNVHFLYIVLAAQVALFAGRTAVDFTRRWILLHLSTRISISLISEFLGKLFRLPLPFFEGRMIGDVLRRIDDHTRVEKFLSTSSLNIIFSLFSLFIFGIVLLIYDRLICLIFFSMSTAYVAYILLFLKRRAALDYKRFQHMADNQSNLIETVQGMSVIKVNNCEVSKRWEWERIQAKLFRVNAASVKLQQYQDAGGLILNECRNLFITVLAALAVIQGSMTLGMMLAVQYIIGQLNSPINECITFIRTWQDAKLSLERIGEIHLLRDEEPSGDVQPASSSRDGKIGGTIMLQNVSFRYEGPHSPKVLDGIDIVIPEGKVTAIVGSSGSGKSTLMKLLLKFYEVNEGRMTIDGEELAGIHAKRWRQNCGVVMQDGFIFSDSIAKNVALSDEKPDRTKLLHAVQVANIKEFIDTLPLGYNTKVGMNGLGLSEGQKQRLLIARAVYKNPEMIFFDEATSALDSNNEKVIMQNLQEFFKDKTVLVIAHRLSTVKNADQVVVLEKGKIVEVGSHRDLTMAKGSYYELVKNQLELGK